MKKKIQYDDPSNKSIYESIPILTIDQCQGQEADYVMLSLVQKPTRFLNKHRFNVALSRVRKRLYFITNRRDFTRASQDASWECNLIAKDLLDISDPLNL
jgi:superfamily I DNA and/or RNA helicase